jgi:hypothetical protein
MENKICFEHRHRSQKENIGRGGAGIGKFVAAILDW